MNVEAARKEYRKIRDLVSYSTGCSLVEFDAAVKVLVGSGGQWLEAAKRVKLPCRRCGGTGQFITGSLNGKLVGPGGQCFRCAGKGCQDWADAKRNEYYDRHQTVRL